MGQIGYILAQVGKLQTMLCMREYYYLLLLFSFTHPKLGHSLLRIIIIILSSHDEISYYTVHNILAHHRPRPCPLPA
jgi:hypothetical protein